MEEKKTNELLDSELDQVAGGIGLPENYAELRQFVTPEMIAAARRITTAQEIQLIAAAKGVTLTLEQAEQLLAILKSVIG